MKELVLEGPDFKVAVSGRQQPRPWPWPWQEANSLPLQVALAAAVGLLSLLFPVFSVQEVLAT